MKLFFIGIGGIGTSGLAQLCQHLGYEVAGSNQGRTGIFDVLEAAGIVCYQDHDPARITGDWDVVVYSEAVPPDNPERIKARALGLRQVSYFEFLGEVASDFRVIAVAGTHGKTTTTGLLCAGLKAAGLDFTALVGSTLPEFGGCNFYQSGDSKWLVVEACEYRNNFQFLKPEIVILTNVELDHVDFYRDEAHYIQTFADFVQEAQLAIYHEEDLKTREVLKPFKAQKFPIPEALLSRISLQLSGDHNRANAGLALGAATYLSLEGLSVDMGKFKQGLSSFMGAGRRQEFLGTKDGVQIYDDYGHHPTEIRATLQALSEKHPEASIGLIFEPHQYSRTKQFFDDFVGALAQASSVGICPIYEARDTEADKVAVSHADVAQALQAPAIETLEDIEAFIAAQKPEVLIFMGAGDISSLAHDFMDGA